MVPPKKHLNSDEMSFVTLAILFIMLIQQIVDTKNPRRDIRVTLLPPCKGNSQFPFRYEGDLIKISDYKFAFNGTIYSDRKMRSPVEVFIEKNF